MLLSPIVLKLRLAETIFENRIGGAAELEIAQKGTLKANMAFVIQVNESVSPNTLDNGINQKITETVGVVVAIPNDTTQKDKTGLTAYDSLYTVRASLWDALLGWTMPGAEYLMEYAGGKLLDINRGYLWYEFDFNVITRLTEADGIDTGEDDLPAFDEIYTQYVMDEDYLPGDGVGTLLPISEGIDMTQIIDFTS